MVYQQQQAWRQLLTAVEADAHVRDLVGQMVSDPVAAYTGMTHESAVGDLFGSAESVDAWLGLAALLEADNRAVTIDWNELPTSLVELIEDLPVITQAGLDASKLDALVELLDDLDAPGVDRVMVAVAFVNAWLSQAGITLVYWDTDSDSYTFVAVSAEHAADIVSAATALSKEAALPTLAALLA